MAHRLYDVPVSPGAAYRRRVTVLAWCLAAAFGVLWLRLGYLQLVRGAECRRRCDSTVRKTQPLAAHRGTIRARDGRVLAVDEPTFDIAVAYPCLAASDPGWLRRQARLHGIGVEEVLERIEAMWAGLARLSATSEGDLRQAAGEVVRRVQAVKDHVSAASGRSVSVREEGLAHPLVRDVDLALVEQVLRHLDEWVGVEVQVCTRRRYPEGSAASHVVGYMLRARDRQVDEYALDYLGDPRRAYQPGETIGAEGVEAACNFDLRGRRGWAQWLVDVRGHVQQTLDRLEPEPGRDVTLTIDLDLQRTAEAALFEACAPHQGTGAAVVLEVRTGQVVALASVPGFDPGAVRQEYAALAREPRKPLLNRVVGAHYPAGSVFKVVDSVAALETGAITPGTRFLCEHRFLVGDRVFGCEGSHGEIEFTPALAKSCNIYFYQVGLATGQPALLAWAYRLGFGRPTGIELPGEVPGVLPAENRQRGSTCNLAIGQGRLAVTPLQVAVMMAQVANGGRRIRPSVLMTADPSRGLALAARRDLPALPVSPATLEAVRHGLREVVTAGTGRRLGLDAVITVAGKTGTAQVGIAGREPHAWFAGYAPAERPEVAFAVIVENGGHGGDVAVPVAREILAQYARRPLRLVSAAN